MTIVVLSADVVSDATMVTARAESLRSQIRETPPAVGFDSVMAPGDPEQRSRRRNAGSITIPEATWADITARLENTIPTRKQS
jgi:L-lactate dehydrogenase/uncharacterized oxidoreductase